MQAKTNAAVVAVLGDSAKVFRGVLSGSLGADDAHRHMDEVRDAIEEVAEIGEAISSSVVTPSAALEQEDLEAELKQLLQDEEEEEKKPLRDRPGSPRRAQEEQDVPFLPRVTSCLLGLLG